MPCSRRCELSPKAAFVINTGNVCENGIVEQFARYQKILADLDDIRSYVAPGNHDVHWNPLGKKDSPGAQNNPSRSSGLGQAPFRPARLHRAARALGPHLPQQLDWLKKDLEKVGPDKPVMIDVRHWIGRDPVMVDTKGAPGRRRALQRRPLVQGHGHANIHWSIEGVPATMVGALSRWLVQHHSRHRSSPSDRAGDSPHQKEEGTACR